MRVALVDRPLSLDEALAQVWHPGAGALDVFLGVVRDTSDGRQVTLLEYEVYASMALQEMSRIASGVEAEFPGTRVAALHRTGSLHVGETAVICAASAPHRDAAFIACRALIDRIKATVPIWKRELGPDGASWAGWLGATCAGGHET